MDGSCMVYIWFMHILCMIYSMYYNSLQKLNLLYKILLYIKNVNVIIWSYLGHT